MKDLWRRVPWVFGLALILCSGSAALRAQTLPFAIVTAGQVPEAVVRATRDALTASFAYLRDIQGPVLPMTVTVTLHERTETFRVALEALGLRIPPGSWVPRGQSFPLGFHLDLSRMPVPTSNVTWFCRTSCSTSCSSIFSASPVLLRSAILATEGLVPGWMRGRPRSSR